MTSQPEIPKAGDMVVPLAALATQCATFAGASTLGTVLYRAGLPGQWVFAGVLLGAVAGLFVGWAFGRMSFPASAANVLVVRTGRGALPKTLFAACVPSVIAGVGIAVIAALSVGAPSLATALAWALGCSLAVGCIFGFGSALA